MMSTHRRRVPDPRDDSGFTLTEVLVAMGLLTIFMTIFTTVTMMMTNTTTKVQRITEGVRQANQAFLSLDRSVRYATAIAPQQKSAVGTWHVEWDTYIVANGVPSDVCTQLRIANNQLQQRSWTVSGSSYASGSLSAWKPLTSNVTNGTVALAKPTSGNDNRPFVLSTSTQFQRLTVTVIAGGDSASATDTNRASVTFSAVNSTNVAPSSVCQQVAVDVTS